MSDVITTVSDFPLNVFVTDNNNYVISVNEGGIQGPPGINGVSGVPGPSGASGAVGPVGPIGPAGSGGGGSGAVFDSTPKINSIPFVSTGGLLTQNNPAFYWDNTGKVLNIGVTGANLDWEPSDGPDAKTIYFGGLNIKSEQDNVLNISTSFAPDAPAYISSKKGNGNGILHIISSNNNFNEVFVVEKVTSAGAGFVIKSTAPGGNQFNLIATDTANNEKGGKFCIVGNDYSNWIPHMFFDNQTPGIFIGDWNYNNRYAERALNRLDIGGNVCIGVDYAKTVVAPANGLVVQGNISGGNLIIASNFQYPNGTTIASQISTLSGNISNTGHNLYVLITGVSGVLSSTPSVPAWVTNSLQVVSGNVNNTGAILISLINGLSGQLNQTGANLSNSIGTTNTNLGATGSTLITYISNTGQNLYNLINGLSGQLNQTGSNLAASINSLTTNLSSTGQTLYNLITNASGELNTNINQISTNLTNTGSVLYSDIVGLSGQLNQSGSNLSQSINTVSSNLTNTGQTLLGLINGVSTNLGNTGSILDNKINSLSGYSMPMVNIAEGVRLVMGVGLQLYNTTTMKWHSLRCVDDPPVLALSTGYSS